MKTDIELRQDDADARQLARSEFAAPVLLEAGAGTGKTATLVARVLVWALGPGWLAKSDLLADPEQERIAAAVLDGIVAITFTDKASVEMSQRLAEATLLIIKGKPVIGIDPTDLPSPAIAESRARSILAQLDRIHVETIHAFCRRTLAENALAAGLHPDFELDADGTAVAMAIRDEVGAWLNEALGADSNSDLVELMKLGFGPGAIEEAAGLIVASGVPTNVLLEDPYPDSKCQEAGRVIARGIDDLVNMLLPCFAASTKKNLAKGRDCLSVLAEISNDIEKAQGVNALMDALEKLDIKGEHKKVDDWAKKGFNKTEAKELELSSICLATAKAKMAALLPLMKSTSNWDPAILRPALRVLATVVERVRSQLSKQGTITFNGLLRRCRDLLRDDLNVSTKLRQNMDQLLVDEVQDTDPLQYDIVRSLAFGDEPKPSLFVVGDPKQTIYGFRSADLGAYDNFMSEIESMGGKKRSLSVNFRSDPPILEEVERIVGPTMVEESGLQPYFEILLCAPNREHDRYHDESKRRAVEYWNSWARYPHRVEEADKILAKTSAGRARQIEATAIAQDIHDLHHEVGTPYSSFAILLKATTQQETYLSALRNLGVPYLVEKDKQFFRRREVIDVSSALACILDCHDQVSLLGWLRSPTVGLPDAAILPLWSSGFPQQVADLNGQDSELLSAIESTIDAAAQFDYRDGLGLSRLKLWPALLRKAVRDLSALRWSIAHETVDVFFEKFRDLYAHEAQESSRFLGAHRVANLRRFLIKSRNLLARPDIGRSEALRLIRANVVEALDGEEASPGDETSDAVRIMSVHKSKGLDFDQVYFVALHQGTGGGSGGDRVFYRNNSWEFSLFGASTPGFGSALEHSARVSKAEMVRTNYVALTRAAKRLVLCGKWPADDKETKGVEDCGTIIDLLGHRSELTRQWESMTSTVSPQEPVRSIDQNDNVVWVMPDHERNDAHQNRHAGAGLGSAINIIADTSRLQQRHAKLEATQGLTTPLSASELKNDTNQDVECQIEVSDSSPLFVPKDPDEPTAWANIVGTAVHKVLEQLPLNEGASEFIENCRQEPEKFIGQLPEKSNRANLVKSFDQRLNNIQESQILSRLSGMEADVLGREIPLLVELDGIEVVGSLDLLYRDSDKDQLVVVDFKTDQVDSEAELLSHAKSYAAQGRAYTKAVDVAFKTGPNKTRFELWFISSDRIVLLK